ncbi:MAG: hypothetical protein ACRDWV_04390 [Acidimicrobiales bacterium]
MKALLAGGIESLSSGRVLVVVPIRSTRNDVVATLGPAGTSSEAAGHALSQMLAVDPDGESEAASPVALYPSYEAASSAVLNESAARLLVANAYHGVNAFYMEPRLALECAFVFDPPQYGVAARSVDPLPFRTRVATHPAPEALLHQLPVAGTMVAEVEYVLSTSAAAALVAQGGADLALTTAPAARLHGLHFVSGTRCIRMLWSVFVRQVTLSETRTSW